MAGSGGLLALVVGLCVAAAAVVPAGTGQLVAPISRVLVGAILLNFPAPAAGFYYLTGEVAYFTRSC